MHKSRAALIHLWPSLLVLAIIGGKFSPATTSTWPAPMLATPLLGILVIPA